MRDRNERKHRRTTKHSEVIEMVSKADFDANLSLAAAMGLEEPEEKETKPESKTDE